MSGEIERYLFGGSLEGLKRMVCSHSETSFADELGKVLCLKCGAVVQSVLTLEVLENAMRRIRDGR